MKRHARELKRNDNISKAMERNEEHKQEQN